MKNTKVHTVYKMRNRLSSRHTLRTSRSVRDRQYTVSKRDSTATDSVLNSTPCLSRGASNSPTSQLLLCLLLYLLRYLHHLLLLLLPTTTTYYRYHGHYRRTYFVLLPPPPQQPPLLRLLLLPARMAASQLSEASSNASRYFYS
ncbi:uncharacterized protein LOC112494208 [Cephus cinctus]|uniref:Uncharacterized protein LOC112494208 n=1 Tax=Cephus cinctus TaxID=211228 RepID=A0AAJ7RF66_CEPCN|nr:uncharacterized protein LOC112494208 [Cephus cinctus]